jgi:secreted trypsin-like serine protease
MISFNKSHYRWFSTASLVVTISVCASTQSTLEIRPISDISNETGHPLVINGQPANADEYPATFLSGVSPSEMCTWFLVSGNTLLGAAHCLRKPDGSVADNISIKTKAGTYKGNCEVPEEFPEDPSRDWAACFITPTYTIPTAPDIPVSGFEVLNIKPDRVVPTTKIEIGGYGCTEQGGTITNNYQIGQARIVTAPPNAHITGAGVSTPNAISIRQAPATLCQGDSGGPAFLYQKTGRVFRIVIGINSSTVIPVGTGYLASTSTTTALSFFKSWADRVGDKLCGVHIDAKGCRPFLK